jgi:hypothetical protein
VQTIFWCDIGQFLYVSRHIGLQLLQSVGQYGSILSLHMLQVIDCPWLQLYRVVHWIKLHGIAVFINKGVNAAVVCCFNLYAGKYDGKSQINGESRKGDLRSHPIGFQLQTHHLFIIL